MSNTTKPPLNYNANHNSCEPIVICKREEVEQMITRENLQYVIVGKFPFGSPDIKS